MNIYTFTVPFKPAGKERPRFANGRTYMPPKYVKWKTDFFRHCIRLDQPHRRIHLTGNLIFTVVFKSKTGKIRPDLDNAVGSILDSIQDEGGRLGLISNDRQIVEIHASIAKSSRDEIVFHLQEVGT
jgi:Holliday junction resolvase RusA-like endonuclease